MQMDPEKDLLELHQRMIDQAREVYSETVVEHWVNPRNPGLMQDPDGRARITGPCGDTMEICVSFDGEAVTGASFITDGCITSIASASMAVELVTGKTIAQAIGISQPTILEALGGLPRDSEHCALLAADTLRAALSDCLRTRNAPWKRLYRR